MTSRFDWSSRVTSYALLVMILAASIGCVEEDAPQMDATTQTHPTTATTRTRGMSLLDHTRWKVQQAGCNRAGWRAEGEGVTQTLLVDTALCDPFDGQQPLPVALTPSDEVEVALWHLNLTAPEPAMATVRLMLGDEVVFERTIPIPSPGGSQEATWRPARPIAAGTPWSLWIENHGGNHWRLQHVRLKTCGGCDA